VPELPEVETVVRDLRPRLVGRRITSVRVGKRPLRRRWSAQWGPRLVGRRVTAVERRGKWIVVALDDGSQLVCHLGMTGQLTVVPAEQPSRPHTHVVLGLDGAQSELRFRDVRRFGSAVWFADRAAVERSFAEAGLGPEPFALDAATWRRCLSGTRRCLKAVLLDQRTIAGVGNIYADESLFEARLHPAQPGHATSPRQAERLRQAIVVVLNRAIDRRGSSINDYVDASGAKGSYQDEFRVYGRPGAPCPRCGRPIRRVRLAGRSTHFCPRCQGIGRVPMAKSVGRNRGQDPCL
jgi:formamidopyrimidine-DNA glycosylase